MLSSSFRVGRLTFPSGFPTKIIRTLTITQTEELAEDFAVCCHMGLLGMQPLTACWSRVLLSCSQHEKVRETLMHDYLHYCTDKGILSCGRFRSANA
jgi:hypothetical protein